MGSPGKVLISTATANGVPDVCVTVSGWLSRLPLGIVMLLAPPLMLPFITLSGSTISNGAPEGATALNCPFPIFSKETVRGSGFIRLLCRSSDVSAVSPSKIPAGRLLNWFSAKMSAVSVLRLSKMPAGRLLNWLLCRLRYLSVLRLSKMPAGRLLNWLESRKR